MAIGKTIALLALVASAALGQRYNGNYVDNDYDYEQASAPAPAPAPARSFSRPAPPPQPLRSSISAANAPRPTPVPILKQINRHNEDGSYTYGYEGADGSFKIETKLTTGEVMGKYGYVDDVGKVRVVEYGANKFGFQPSGEGITVAPPTLVDETRRNKPGELPEYDDGSYFEAPAPRPAPRSRPAPPAPRPAPQPAPRPAPHQQQQAFSSYEASYGDEQSYSAPAPAPRPAPRPSPSFSSGSPGPVPPRAVVAGAAPAPPSGGIAYARPAPPRQPAPVRPPPQHHQHQPQQHQQQHQAPVYHAQPVASFAPAPQRPSRGGGGGSLLDQLARDYALPSGGSNPLTDISFSSYY